MYNYPFLMGQGVWLDSDKLGPTDEVREVLKHGTLSIGFIGLAETLTALYGHHHGESDEMQKKAWRSWGHMRQFCDDKSQAMKMNFTLLATPAEGLSGRFTRMDQKRYGTIPGVTDREYYTNSFHIPVWYPISAYDKIQKEAPYHALTNAATSATWSWTATPLTTWKPLRRGALHARRGRGLRQHQPPGGPGPGVRLCGRDRGRVPPVRPPAAAKRSPRRSWRNCARSSPPCLPSVAANKGCRRNILLTCSPAILSGKKTNHTSEEEKKMSAMQKQSVVGKDVPFERIAGSPGTW